MKENKKIYLGVMSVAFIVLMCNMIFIDAESNDLIPHAVINVDKNLVDIGESVRFYVTNIDGIIEQFIYLFHDGTEPVYSTSGEIYHSFPLEGKYLVSLIAVGSHELTHLSTVQVQVRNQQPSVDISIPSSALEDEVVEFSAINIIDTPNDLSSSLKFQWLTGDGTLLNGSTVQYSWNYSAQYPVTLYLSDDQDAVNYAVEFINISNVPPVANFTCPDLIYKDQSITFNASSSLDTPSDIESLKHYWSFGDGVVAKGDMVEHTFTRSGNYNVTLTVIDDDGAKDSHSKILHVNNIAPTIDLSPKNLSVFEGDTTTFYADSNDTITDFQVLNYTWDNGAKGWQNSRLWTDDGTENISVMVSDPEALWAQDFTSVLVENLPPEITVSKAYIKTNLSFDVSGTTANYFTINMFVDDNLIFNQTVQKINESTELLQLPLVIDVSKDFRIEILYNNTHCFGYNPSSLHFELENSFDFQLNHLFWSFDEDPWAINLNKYFYHFPITFNGSIFDPGLDEYDVSAQYKMDIGIAIHLDVPDCPDPHYSFELPGNISVDYTFWIENSTIYNILNITKDLLDLQFVNTENTSRENSFSTTINPINLDFLDLLEMIDLFGLIEIEILERKTYLEVMAEDDDGGKAVKQVDFISDDGKLRLEGMDLDFIIDSP
ncbi:MAG: PKD domain-containing protein, partial [Candidatus Lokiarchaeota archaeon]|nr:PKD domain-containing protein [Candidatus Lokiarchaeota archaeon]MBD3227878.1 PKD domain-containing protein [Candidatus Lokiarchaeota archaeon]